VTHRLLQFIIVEAYVEDAHYVDVAVAAADNMQQETFQMVNTGCSITHQKYEIQQKLAAKDY